MTKFAPPLLHLSFETMPRSTPPHTPRGGVVEQEGRSTCSTLLHPTLHKWSCDGWTVYGDQASRFDFEGPRGRARRSSRLFKDP